MSNDGGGPTKSGGVSVPINGWTVALVLLILMVGFVVWGTEMQHELFLSGVERLVAALRALLK